MSSIDMSTLLLGGLIIGALENKSEELEEAKKASDAVKEEFRKKLQTGNKDSEVFGDAETLSPVLRLMGAIDAVNFFTENHVTEICPETDEDKLRQLLYLEALGDLKSDFCHLVTVIGITDEELQNKCAKANVTVSEAVNNVMMNQLREAVKSRMSK